jgi:hypothetical protein
MDAFDQSMGDGLARKTCAISVTLMDQSWFKVQRSHVPTLNLERETLNCAEGAILNVEL